MCLIEHLLAALRSLATSGGYQARHRGVPVHKPCRVRLKKGCSASDAQELSMRTLFKEHRAFN